MAKKYNISLTITNVGGICPYGIRTGDKYNISPLKTDNLCGIFYHSIYPTLTTFYFGGEMSFLIEKDKMEVRCPDFRNEVWGIIERTPIEKK